MVEGRCDWASWLHEESIYCDGWKPLKKKKKKAVAKKVVRKAKTAKKKVTKKK